MNFSQTRKPARLLDRPREAIRVRQYSLATERIYLWWVRRFVLFRERRHPAALPPSKAMAEKVGSELHLYAE